MLSTRRSQIATSSLWRACRAASEFASDMATMAFPCSLLIAWVVMISKTRPQWVGGACGRGFSQCACAGRRQRVGKCKSNVRDGVRCGVAARNLGAFEVPPDACGFACRGWWSCWSNCGPSFFERCCPLPVTTPHFSLDFPAPASTKHSLIIGGDRILPPSELPVLQ